MLREFEYLGSDKAEEVVITNTRKIATMCERIEPVRPDKCAPVIPNSDETLRSICYNKAHEMYGENLPKIVVDRLERELNSIISNGFAVMYIIAQKLVWKSNEDGYLVGSRIRRLLAGGHNVGYHGSKPAQPSLLLHQLSLL